MIGIYKGKIKEYTIGETKTAGNPQVVITFDVLDEEGNIIKVLSWYSGFVGGQKDITLKSLIACGLKPQNFGKLQNLRNGVQSGMLDMGKILSLDIQEEPKQDGYGMVTKIQWVNDPETAPQAKKIDEAKNAQYFGSMGFEADLIRLAGELGIPLNNSGSNTMGNNQNFNNGGQQNMNMNMGNQNNVQGANNGQNQATQYNQQNNGQNNSGNGYAQNVSNSNQNMNQNNGVNGNYQAPF